MKQNIGNWLTRRSQLSANREAFVDGQSGERISFSELEIRSNKIANALLSRGVKQGDRVALLLTNCFEFIEVYFALAKIGAILVPLNWRLVPDELEFILQDSGSSLLVFEDTFSEVVETLHSRASLIEMREWLQVERGEAIVPFAKPYRHIREAGSDVDPNLDIGDDDLLYIMYTSGTTGLPKGVVHSHTTMASAIQTFTATMDLREHDRFLSALPLFHVGALTPLTLMVYRGVTSILMRNFEPQRVWELIEEEQITTGLAVPAMLNFMLDVPDKSRFDYSSLRWFLTGAAPVSPGLINAYTDLKIELLTCYGLTESCGPGSVIAAEDAIRKIGSIGKPFFHTDVKIVRTDGSECDADEPGEILVRGNHVMLEYWNRPEDTAKTLVNGWLHTGDVGRLDEEGFLYIEDRIKDMIISGGENIYPAEIENILQTHPKIIESAVIGQPSNKWGESPLAIIVRRDPSLTETEVMHYLGEKVARYKLPQGVVFQESIPRNPTGKILKRLLRDKYPGPAPI